MTKRGFCTTLVFLLTPSYPFTLWLGTTAISRNQIGHKYGDNKYIFMYLRLYIYEDDRISEILAKQEPVQPWKGNVV